MKKKCTGCGTLNYDDAISCRECGGRAFTTDDNDYDNLLPTPSIEPSIEPLIAELKAFGGKGDYAQEKLTEIGAPAVKLLLQVLASPESDMQQRRARNILFQMMDPRVVKILVDALLHHPSWFVRKEVARILKAAFHWEPENNEQDACLAVIEMRLGRAEELGLLAIEPLIRCIKQGDGSVDFAKSLEDIVVSKISEIPANLLSQLSKIPDLVTIEYQKEYEPPGREEEHGSSNIIRSETIAFDSSQIRKLARRELKQRK